MKNSNKIQIQIQIQRNPNGDTRTALKNVSFEQFEQANISHKGDVLNVMAYLGNELYEIGLRHDFTKTTFDGARKFYRDFKNTINNGADFVGAEWYQNHIKEERHHLLSNCPEDVNLLDVLEMLSDCVCAGLARSGEVRPLEINNEILQKAVSNTVELIKKNCEVVD